MGNLSEWTEEIDIKNWRIKEVFDLGLGAVDQLVLFKFLCFILMQ